jgi:hypothetical protein
MFFVIEDLFGIAKSFTGWVIDIDDPVVGYPMAPNQQ